MKKESDPARGLISTGIVGLDEVFLGGVPRGNSVLLEGAPGAGKTTLALEFIYRGALQFAEPGLVVSFESTPEKLLRDSSSFGWDFQPLIDSGAVSFIYTTPSVLIEELLTHNGVLTEKIRSSKASRVVVDGLTPLRLFGESSQGRPFRESLQLLLEHLSGSVVTSILTREETASSDMSHERFLVDTIIRLGTYKRLRSLRRSIEIVKSRGQEYMSGEHTLRLEQGKGVAVYPRVKSRPKGIQNTQPTSCERLSIGVTAIDSLLGGGLLKGSITLIVGISGTGKTVTGMQFLTEGARQGKCGLLVSLDEHPAQIIRNAEGLGLPFEEMIAAKQIVIDYDSPLELELDIHFKRVVDCIERLGTDRVVIDSLAVYETAAPEEARDFIYALATFLKDRGITALLNYESPELLGISQISEALKASPLVDNIILLNYVEISTRLRRAISIPKVRGSNISQRTREYVIKEAGIALLDETSGEAATIGEVPQLPFSAYYGLLSRSPVRQSPVVDALVSRGEDMPDSVKMKLDN